MIALACAYCERAVIIIDDFNAKVAHDGNGEVDIRFGNEIAFDVDFDIGLGVGCNLKQGCEILAAFVALHGGAATFKARSDNEGGWAYPVLAFTARGYAKGREAVKEVLDGALAHPCDAVYGISSSTQAEICREKAR